jgi:hypothetical protein
MHLARARTAVRTSRGRTPSTSINLDDTCHPIDPFDHHAGQMRQQDTTPRKIT